MTGFTLRKVKYSVGFLPQVMISDETPFALSSAISCSTARCWSRLKPPASPRSDAMRMNSTFFSDERPRSRGWESSKPALATLASMLVMASLYGVASSALLSAERIRAVEIISMVRVICMVLLMEDMRRCISRRLAIARYSWPFSASWS